MIAAQQAAPAATATAPARLTMDPLAPERIVFCIDTSSEMSKPWGSSHHGVKKAPRFQRIRDCLRLFMNIKLIMNPNHRFAVLLAPGPQAYWLSEFTADIDLLWSKLCSVAPTDEQQTPPAALELSSLMRRMNDMVSAEPGTVLRCILICARQSVVPLPRLGDADQPNRFFLDVLYVHHEGQCATAKATAQATYDGIMTACTDCSYVFDITIPKKLDWFFCQLLRHPSLRQKQIPVS